MVGHGGGNDPALAETIAWRYMYNMYMYIFRYNYTSFWYVICSFVNRIKSGMY